MKLFPERYKISKPKEPPLQSYLFGHRLQASQTKYEYLLEFLMIALARKKNGITDRPDDTMFPIDGNGGNDNIKYYPEARIGLKRFIFYPKSKMEGKAEVDNKAYDACVKALYEHIEADSDIKRQNAVTIIQNLLNSFCAVNQNRSWFDQNMLPVCREAVMPESMGIKSWRQHLDFDMDRAKVDTRFDFKKNTYFCRGGEVYYLHLLSAINEYPEKKNIIEKRLSQMIDSFPQFSYLCSFIQETWDEYMNMDAIPDDSSSQKIEKDPKFIPAAFAKHNAYTLSELENFLCSKTHPFEKMEIFSDAIILQLLRLSYMVSSSESSSNCWVIDVNSRDIDNEEVKKAAINAFRKNEETINNYLYNGLELYREKLNIKDDAAVIKKAAEDSYKLFRKMGKTIGIIIPAKGPGMRFTLPENIIKFLVLSIIPPRNIITLDEFLNQLYKHYGIVVGPDEYREEIKNGTIEEVTDLSFMVENKRAFAQKLKDCGFLRDLSDATAIVENPYETEREGDV